jgi:cobalt-zinc-cadmium efflux system protein
MSDHHTHQHSHQSAEKNLLITTLLNVIITIAEIVGGLLSNSLALLSDALHNLSDAVAVFIAYLASLISRRNSTEKKTFGYKRVEILAALFNAVVLIVICVFLMYEAYLRFLHPEPIKGAIMFWVALVGLLANLFAVLLLHNHTGDSLNVKAAYLHLLGDTFSSVLVILSSILIYYFQVYWIDPLITLIISLYIIKEAYSILKEAVNILMQFTPENIDINKIKYEIERITDVENIHHVHIWSLNDLQIHFECHIDLRRDLKISETEDLRNNLKDLLVKEFGISHTTIQFEFNCCDQKSLIH